MSSFDDFYIDRDTTLRTVEIRLIEPERFETRNRSGRAFFEVRKAIARIDGDGTIRWSLLGYRLRNDGRPWGSTGDRIPSPKSIYPYWHLQTEDVADLLERLSEWLFDEEHL